VKRAKFAFIVISSALLAACASSGTAPSIDTGPDAEVSFDGLNRVSNSRADKAWAREGLDLSGYTKIKLENAGFEYRPGGESSTMWAVRRSSSGPYHVTESQKARFEEAVGDVFREELARGQRYVIVDEAGPDVLLVRGGMLDIVSMVPPEGVGRTDIYLNKVGEATLLLELRDSETNSILARSLDRRAAERPGNELTLSNPVTNRAEVRRLARRWASSLRGSLDEFLDN
jgi:hypothetical protein